MPTRNIPQRRSTDQPYLTLTEVCRILHVSKDTASDFFKSGKLEGWHAGRRILTTHRAIEKFLRRNPCRREA